MTVEVATYIHQLDSTLPLAADLISEGDDHIRKIKSTVKATFPNVAGAVTATHVELNALVGFTGAALSAQLAAKANKAGETYAGAHDFSGASGVTLPGNTAIGAVTPAQIGYLSGVTSAIQSQINGKASLNGATYTGAHDFTAANMAIQQPPAGDATNKPATTAFVASVAMSAALPGQTGNAGKIIGTDGSTASWRTPDFPASGPSSVTLTRTSGVLTSVTGVIDGKTFTRTLNRVDGLLSTVVSVFDGKTRTETFNRDGNGILQSVTAVES